MTTIAVKAGAATFTGAAVAAVATAPTPAAGVFSIVVLGIPLGVLGAALAGAATRYLREPPQAEKDILPKLVGTLTDGLVGGWLAMLLIGLPSTAGYVGQVVRPEIVGALCALVMQYLRSNVAEWANQLVRNLLSWLGKRGSQ